MVGTSPARAVAFAYVLVVSAAAAALILVGALVERLPLVPAGGSDAYERAMFGTLGWLARPVDRLACRPADRDVAPHPAEWPGHPPYDASPPRRHN